MNFSDEFQNGETLLRGIRRTPSFWNDQQNRPSSGAFKKDPNGLSVNRTGEDRKYYRESRECLEKNPSEFEIIAELEVDFCKSLDLYLKYCPIDDNVYHSEIHKSENEPSLTQSIAKKLAQACVCVIIS